MVKNSCNHCGFDTEPGQNQCPNCGTRLPQEKESGLNKRFIIWFVIVVIFSLSMVVILPR